MGVGQRGGRVAEVVQGVQQANTYGGIYTWDDVAAMKAYQGGKIFQGLQANPHMIDVTVRDFSVLAGPTKVTRGGY